jgi:hypothetical protein
VAQLRARLSRMEYGLATPRAQKIAALKAELSRYQI